MLSESLSLVAAARALREGTLTSEELTRACLERIRQEDGQLQAWVLVDEQSALEQARRCDQERRSGYDRGWLHGIPVGVKDIIDVAGWPTRCGVPSPDALPAHEDAFVVRRLRQAGAVILGKTVTTPYAAFDPPPTRHPWLPDRTPGGSSSGSAVAVARGMCLAALATQTGGSITRPAAYCGVAGLKPTYGRISLHGVLLFAPSLDHVGAIACKVADLAVMFSSLAGFDPNDPQSVNLPVPACEVLLQQSEHPPRLGLISGPWEERVASVWHEHFAWRMAAWRNRGASFQQVQPPDGWQEVLHWHRVIMAVEAATFHEKTYRHHPDRYPPKIASLIEEGVRTAAVEYVRARREQERFRREMVARFAEVDALITPAAPGPPPDAETTGDPCCNAPWSLLGYPTISFPIAYTAAKEPLAVQLVGRPFAESALFAAALWCEAVG
jgi:Asp-tRNA(Asn)/Glu-tRNA(Gln) amidotransferase A subunit family amidase